MLELAVEEAVDDEEPVRGRKPFERPLVGGQQLRRRGDVVLVGQPLPGPLESGVREGGPQPRGMAGELVGTLERLVGERILVVDPRIAELGERVGILARTRPPPSRR